MRFLNSWVCWSNFVSLGCPTDGGRYEPRGGYRCLADIRLLADKLLGEVEEFASPELLHGSLSCEGKRGVIDELLSQVSCTVGACYGDLRGPQGQEAGLPTLPVKADRIAVPEVAGMVDPCEWLDEDRATVVRNLDKLRLPEHQWEEVVKAFHQVPPEEEDRVVRKLLRTGMGRLLPESELPRDSHGKLLVGGLFSVLKNEREDRLIFDRRPENATMSRLRWAKLPAGACFAKLLLDDCEFLRGSGDDLRNYYYMLRLPENWIKYNSAGRRVSSAVLREFSLDPNIPHRVCFAVLGMGDKNGCDVAQAVHEALLRRHGVLRPENTLHYGEHLPEGDLLEGVYLDDLLVVKRCKLPAPIPLDGSFVAPAPQADDVDVMTVQAAEAAYVEAKLQRAEHKAFRQCTSFKAWGAEIDGVRGLVGSPLEVHRQVWHLIQKVVVGVWASVEVLRKVAGYLSFAFQYRREFYSLKHHLYKFVARMKRDRWVRLPGHILDELRACALHLPFAQWNMRKALSQTLMATDATPTSGGCVSASITKELGQALWRHTEVRGEATRLDRSEFLELQKEAPREASQFASTVSECLGWKVESSYTFRQTSHINLQEARALKKEVARLAADPEYQNHVIIFLNDSFVVTGACAKGRSSSYKLNGILRAMLPHMVLGGLSLGIIWIETSSNMADHPSRFSSLPLPRSPPAWLRKFGVGLSKNIVGLEIFAGSARITDAHRKLGLCMDDPIDLLYGSDACSRLIDEAMLAGRYFWIWLAPPCGSFSPLRNLDHQGPLRPKGFPEGFESHPDVAKGNALWRRALQLLEVALKAGVYVFLEHPCNSAAWRMRETELRLNHGSLRSYTVDWCAYSDETRKGDPNRKPTRIITNAPWLEGVQRRCPGNHVHGPPLRGARARRAGAYPTEFCQLLADALRQWSSSAILA